MSETLLDICQRQLHHAGTLGLARDMQEQLLDLFAGEEMAGTAEEAMRLFDRLDELSGDDLIRFANNYEAMHLSVMSVTALKVRVDALEMDPETRHGIQTEISHIIADDVGLQGHTHHHLFERFARELCETGRWRDATEVLPATVHFRDGLHRLRTRGAIEKALATLIVSEIWNTGEYTFAESRTAAIFDNRTDDHLKSRNANAYVSVHAGETEFDHFLHAVSAFDQYTRHIGLTRAEALTVLRTVAAVYFGELKQAILPLNEALYASQPKAAVTGDMRPRAFA